MDFREIWGTCSLESLHRRLCIKFWKLSASAARR